VTWLLLAAFLAATWELTGVVVDPGGQPVTEATVWLSQDRQVTKTLTDFTGRFVLSSVKTGPVEIVAAKEGYAIGGTRARMLGTASVTLRLGEPDSIRLRILDPTHKPVPGARIMSMVVGDRFHVPIDDLAAEGFPAQRSDESGRMAIPDLPNSSYIGFVISHPKYTQTRVPYLPVGGEEHDVLIYPGLTLRGRVTSEKGLGVERARVSVFRAGADSQREFSETLTDPEGFYHAIVSPGEYSVAVKHPDFASPAPRPILLAPEKEEYFLDLSLPSPHVIEGSMRGPHNRAAPGVRVAYVVEGNIYEDVLTDKDGRFTLQVAEGEGIVRTFPPDGYMTESLPDIRIKVGAARHVELRPIRLKALPEIVGTVLGPDRQPQAGVVISSLDLKPVVWTIANSQGEFSIRLACMPKESKAQFRAEHPLRFLRQDFEVNLANLKPIEVQTKPFSPDLSPPRPQFVLNDLWGMEGIPAPEISCNPWFNSEPLSLAQLRGKVVVLAFWAGFDKQGPGRDRLEEFRALHQALHAAGDVVFIGVHESSSEPQEVEEYIREFRIPFPVGRDKDPFVTFDAYNTRYIPQAVLIDKKGILRYFEVEGRLLELIKSLRREEP
jgi:peroxiredoxin